MKRFWLIINISLLFFLGAFVYVYAASSCTGNICRVDNGTNLNITGPGANGCKIITNGSSTPIMAPIATSGEWDAFLTYLPSLVTAGSCLSPCNLPWGGTINSGQSVTAYSASSSSNCAGISESRSCTDGVLSGSYTYGSCTPLLDTGLSGWDFSESTGYGWAISGGNPLPASIGLNEGLDPAEIVMKKTLNVRAGDNLSVVAQYDWGTDYGNSTVNVYIGGILRMSRSFMNDYLQPETFTYATVAGDAGTKEVKIVANYDFGGNSAISIDSISVPQN